MEILIHHQLDRINHDEMQHIIDDIGGLLLKQGQVFLNEIDKQKNI